MQLSIAELSQHEIAEFIDPVEFPSEPPVDFNPADYEPDQPER